MKVNLQTVELIPFMEKKFNKFRAALLVDLPEIQQSLEGEMASIQKCSFPNYI